MTIPRQPAFSGRVLFLAALGLPFCLAAASPPAAREPVRVHIAGIQMVGPEQVALFLADEKEERAVPMAVGRDQGVAIYLGKERAQTPRPMTHDLVVEILKALGAGVDRVTVTEVRQETYYAEIALRSGKKVQPIDARPSDAIALAVRLDAPIFAAPDLLRPLSAAGRPATSAETDRRLGLSVQEIDPDLAESFGVSGVDGVLVASVRPGGAADGAGVRRGDILQAIEGRPTPDLPACRAALAQAGVSPSFGVWRDGRALTLRSPAGSASPPRGESGAPPRR